MIDAADSRIDDLLTLGDIICKHDLEEVAGVTLVHRHHDLSPTERIVWRLRADKTWLATPEVRTDNELSAKNWIVSVGPEGPKLLPTEFIPNEADYQPEIAASEIILSQHDFLHEFSQFAVDNGIENILGLGILHQRSEFKLPDTTVFETSNINKRTTQAEVIPFTDSDTDLGGVTLWHFTKLDGLHGKHRCAHGNSGHCCGN